MNRKTDNNTIRIEVNLSVPPEKAWPVLTRPDHIANWWGSHVYLEPKAGGVFREVWMDEGRKMITSGKITAFNPPSELTMTWADEGWPGNTIVHFLFTENGKDTLLLFEHSGWEIHPEDQRQHLIDAHEEGWRNYLYRFAEYSMQQKKAAGR